MKILAVGDLHFKQNYPYAEEFPDRRVEERKAIEDKIVEASEPCDMVVLMGDIFDSRQNAAATVRDVTSFIERFGSKKVVIMAGNHENGADGTSALDYLSEIVGKNWVFVNNGVVTLTINDQSFAFVPYLRPSTLGLKTNQEVAAWIQNELNVRTKYNAGVFLHHALSQTATETGQMTDLFDEPVIDSAFLHKLWWRVFGAHIHNPQDFDRVHVLGSVMNFDITESKKKRVIRWDTDTDAIESIPLPGRTFKKLVDPQEIDVAAAAIDHDLVRVVTDKPMSIQAEGMKAVVKVVEKPKESRRKGGEITDFSIPNLLKIYAQERSIDLDRLMDAYKHVEGK